MKIRMINDELYPYYIFTDDDFYPQYDLPEKLIKEYKSAQKRFEKTWEKLKIELEKK